MPDAIAAAVDKLEREETYRDIGIASIPDTVESVILSKSLMGDLSKNPESSSNLLLARLAQIPLLDSDLPRIGFFVALGRLGQKKAVPALVQYLLNLPDDEVSEIGRINHPFRYALRALERLTGDPFGLGPGEDLEALFKSRKQTLNDRSKLKIF
ncbi:MAG: hypothetical protein ACREA9_24715 [Pyrinomonadaceae bacterium]